MEYLCGLFLPFQFFLLACMTVKYAYKIHKRGSQPPQKSTFLYETFTRPLRDIHETFMRPCAGVEPYLLPTRPVPDPIFPATLICLAYVTRLHFSSSRFPLRALFPIAPVCGLPTGAGNVETIGVVCRLGVRRLKSPDT